MRQIEEDALHRRMLLKNGRDLRSVAAANVGNNADAGKVVGVENSVRLTAMNPDHRCVENASLVGMIAQVIEDWLAKHLVEGDLAGLNAVLNLSPRSELLIAR